MLLAQEQILQKYGFSRDHWAVLVLQLSQFWPSL